MKKTKILFLFLSIITILIIYILDDRPSVFWNVFSTILIFINVFLFIPYNKLKKNNDLQFYAVYKITISKYRNEKSLSKREMKKIIKDKKINEDLIYINDKIKEGIFFNDRFKYISSINDKIKKEIVEMYIKNIEKGNLKQAG